MEGGAAGRNVEEEGEVSEDVKSEGSRESWPSLAETLNATEFESDVFVRRENKRLGWKRCCGSIQKDVLDKAFLLVRSDRTELEWSLEDVAVVAEKRTGLRVSQQSTGAARPSYRLGLYREGERFDVGFFGPEVKAKEQRDAWVLRLLLNGAKSGPYSTARAVSSALASQEPDTAKAALAALERSKENRDDDDEDTLAYRDCVRLAAQWAAIGSGELRKCASRVCEMAPASVLAASKAAPYLCVAKCTTLVRQLVDVRPLTKAARLCRASILNDLDGAGCRFLYELSLRGDLDAAVSLTCVSTKFFTLRFFATFNFPITKDSARVLRTAAIAHPDTFAEFLAKDASNLSCSVLVRAMSDCADYETRCDLALTLGVSVVRTRIDTENDPCFKTDPEPTSNADKVVLSSERLPNLEHFDLSLLAVDPAQLPPVAVAGDHGGEDHDGEEEDEEEKAAAAAEKKKQQTKKSSTKRFSEVFESGGQSGLGLELTAGPWRDATVAPAVHRTNNATHRRGVAFQDELIEVNGRGVVYALRKGAPHSDVRSAMISACDAVRDAPWPKRLAFVRRSKTQDNEFHFKARHWAHHQDEKTTPDDFRKRALEKLARCPIDVLCDPDDGLRTRLVACRILKTLAQDKLVRKPKLALKFASEELKRAAGLLASDGLSSEAEDFAIPSLGAYAYLLPDDGDLLESDGRDPTANNNGAALVAAVVGEEQGEGTASEWWNDPQARYEEFECRVDEPPLGCTMALRGADPANFACRVESVDPEGRAFGAGIRVDDVLLKANDTPAPRKALIDTALVDFFKDKRYPMTLTLIRFKTRVVDDATSSDAAATNPVAVEEEEEEFDDDDGIDHHAALLPVVSTLLYSNRPTVATLAAFAIDRAARGVDSRRAAHERVMYVAEATAVAVTPAAVQRLSSWTPPQEQDEGLSRDEAAALVPLAETQFSDAVDGARTRILTQHIMAPQGSAVAKLLEDAADSSLVGDDLRRRKAALDALASLCASKPEDLAVKAAAAVVAEPDALKETVKLIGGSRGAAVAQAAVRFVLHVAARGFETDLVAANALQFLAWVVRVEPRSETHRPVLGVGAAEDEGEDGEDSSASNSSDQENNWFADLAFSNRVDSTIDDPRCKDAALEAAARLVEKAPDTKTPRLSPDPDEASKQEAAFRKSIVDAVSVLLERAACILDSPEDPHYPRAATLVCLGVSKLPDAATSSVVARVARRVDQSRECADAVSLVASEHAHLLTSESGIAALVRLAPSSEAARRGLEKVAESNPTECRRVLTAAEYVLETFAESCRRVDTETSSWSLIKTAAFCGDSRIADAVVSASPTSVAQFLARGDRYAIDVANLAPSSALFDAVERTNAASALYPLIARGQPEARDAAAFSLSKLLDASSVVPEATLERLLKFESPTCGAALASVCELGIECDPKKLRTATARALFRDPTNARRISAATYCGETGAELADMAVKRAVADVEHAAARLAADLDHPAGRAAPLAVLALSTPETPFDDDEIPILEAQLDGSDAAACALTAFAAHPSTEWTEAVRQCASSFLMRRRRGEGFFARLGAYSAAKIAKTCHTLHAEVAEALTACSERDEDTHHDDATVLALCDAVFAWKTVDEAVLARVGPALADLCRSESREVAAAASSSLAALALISSSLAPILQRAATEDPVGTPLLLFALRRLGVEPPSYDDVVNASPTTLAFAKIAGHHRPDVLCQLLQQEDEPNDPEPIDRVEEEKQPEVEEVSTSPAVVVRDDDDDEEKRPIEDDSDESIVEERLSIVASRIDEELSVQDEPTTAEAREVAAVQARADDEEEDTAELDAVLEIAQAEADEDAILAAALELSAREAERETRRRSRQLQEAPDDDHDDDVSPPAVAVDPPRLEDPPVLQENHAPADQETLEAEPSPPPAHREDTHVEREPPTQPPTYREEPGPARVQREAPAPPAVVEPPEPLPAPPPAEEEPHDELPQQQEQTQESAAPPSYEDILSWQQLPQQQQQEVEQTTVEPPPLVHHEQSPQQQQRPRTNNEIRLF